MKLNIGNKTKHCGNVCLTDNLKNHYIIMSDFMLGDADAYKSESQGEFKKINTSMIDIVLALEVSLDRRTEDLLLSEYLSVPYSEVSHWFLEDYRILFMNKDGQLFDVFVEFNGDEISFIKSESWIK